MQYGTLNYNETSLPVRSVFESFECATCWRYFHEIFTIFSPLTTFDAKDWNDANDDFQISWIDREKIVKISWNILEISWKYHENIVSRENIVKISWKYREKIVSRENVVITLRKSRLLTQMTEMMQAEYRENIVKISSSG